MATKSTQELYVDNKFFSSEEMLKFASELTIPKAERYFQQRFNCLLQELNSIFQNDWIEIKNKKVYYMCSENIIVPDLNRMNVGEADTYYPIGHQNSSYQNTSFEGFNGLYLNNINSVRRIFFRSSCPFREQYSFITYYSKQQYHWCGASESGDFNSYNRFYSKHIPVVQCTSGYDLENLINYKIFPKGLNNEVILSSFIKAIEDGIINILYETCKVKFTEKAKAMCIDGSLKEVLGVSFAKKEMVEFLKEYCTANTIHLTENMLKSFGKPYLECDLKRADIEPYDLKCLTDINGGHWDLWKEKAPKNKFKVRVDTSLVGRNPVEDIHWDGLVGIDFGTKSTVVAYQDGSDKTYLQRIGMGQLSKKAEPKHYENPTVMEFIDLKSFIEQYTASLGRPETSWQDMTVSHTAQNNLNESDKSEFFYSYFYDLKQWCANKNQIKIKDQNGIEMVLPSYLELEENDFDPIEIYAYYLGLFINNMRNGIYIDYIMSFPVTYEKAVREKIISSFKKGLMKSMPDEILENEDIMSRFRVQSGASEPACYAICALQQFNIEPEDDEEIFYGIFDFGGGTTDFDFGVWRFADETNPRERRYDYVIEHFGAGGDQYLGGENLLELMAYEVFKANVDVLRKTADNPGYSFYKPVQCDIFDGSEAFLSSSQEAKRNTKQLMEKIRPLMENLRVNESGEIRADEEYFKNDGKLQVSLFNKNGELKPNVTLFLENSESGIKVDLIAILIDRIEQGVRNFFQALLNNYDTSRRPGCVKWKNISVFLAGNSSKSPIVKMLFNKYIDIHTKAIIENYNLDSNEAFFKMYEPLGTAEADKIQENNGKMSDVSCVTRATGKTGVAYGLLDGRAGSKILVISEVKAQSEIPFQFYVGYSRRGKFKTLISRGDNYGKWIDFVDSFTSDFEIYYSNLPESSDQQTPIEKVKKKKCVLPKVFDDDNIRVFIRPIKPNVLEYAVAREDEIEKDIYIIEPVLVELNT